MTRERRIVLVLAAATAIVAATAAFVAWSVVSGSRDLDSRTQAALDRVETFEASRPATDVGEQNAEDLSLGDPGPGDPGPGDLGPGDLAFQDLDGDDATSTEADPAIAAGDVLLINRVPGDDYRRLVVRHASGGRTMLDKTCERFHIAGTTGICLDGPQVLGRYAMEILDFSDPALPLLWSSTTTLPSRTRVSADQEWASSTVFLEGSGYQDLGGFSTIAWIIHLEGDRQATGVDAMIIEDAEPHHGDPAANFWGVSFGQNGNFWVTGAFGEHVELLQGSAADKTLQPTGIEGSCPSLSPDGSTLVYKRQLESGDYQLVAMDLANGDVWDLGETRPVDDQVEWLDEDTILYGMHAEDWTGDAVDPEFDTWRIDIAPGSRPELFAPQGDSPAVVR